MSRYATATDFFGGAMYTEYKRFPIFAERADVILARWPAIVDQKALVVGCGPGAYLVEELVNRGVNCYGIDGFKKNLGHGFVTIAPIPAIASRCILDADTTNNSDVTRIASREFLDLRGQAKTYLTISEDVLSCLTLQEVSAAVNIMQSRSDRVFHILTVNRSETGPDPERDTTMGLNWLSESSWRTLINSAGGSSHICWNSEERRIF